MNTDSNNGWKILLSVAVVALFASAVLFFKSDSNLATQDVQELVKQSSEPTANISSVDDVEIVLLSNVSDEVKLLEESSSAEDLSSDSTALEGLGKTYDENTL